MEEGEGGGYGVGIWSREMGYGVGYGVGIWSRIWSRDME